MYRQKLLRFARNENGNFAMITALMVIPMSIMLGMAVDYGRASTERSSMQNALDVASMSVASMSKDATDGQRQERLTNVYLANGGTGSATLDKFSFGNKGEASVEASANANMPTTFMHVAGLGTSEIGVKSEVDKAPSLIEATFQIEGASGHWNKTMTLYGKKYGATAAKKLMSIQYTRIMPDIGSDPKGYGRMVISKITQDSLGRDVATVVQTQTCTTKTVLTLLSTLLGDYYGSGQKQQQSGLTKWLTDCTTVDSGGTNGAKIDVSDMEELYLQMNVDATGKVFKSNDPATSSNLFLSRDANKANLQRVAANTKVDIFSVVPCEQTSAQAWEDGGTNPADVYSNADFFYTVTGKCDLLAKRGALIFKK